MVSKIYSKFATDAELLAASGKLQQEINQGGGGSGTADLTNVVTTTGDQSISGQKTFLGRLLALANNVSSIDSLNRKLFDGSGQVNINWESGYAYSTIVDYQESEEEAIPILGNSQLSVDWQGRVLWDRFGNPSIDWDFNYLYAGGSPSIDWGFRELYNEDGYPTVKWQSRHLDADDGISIDWGLRQLHAYNGDVVVNWDSKALIGTYVEDFVNIIEVETLDWSNRQLLIGEANGFSSLNWESSILQGTGINSSGVLSNHTTADWQQGILYSIRDSNEGEDGENPPFISDPSIDWQNKKLLNVINFGSEEFPDWQAETTLDWSGRYLHGTWGFVDGYIAAYGSPDEETGERPVEGYLVMPGLNGMGFNDANDIPLLSATQRRLYGLNPEGFIETSLHWGNRIAFDNIGVDSINWNRRELSTTFLAEDGEGGFYDDAIVSLNWSGRKLYESGTAGVPVTSLDWQARELVGANGSVALDWQYKFLFDENHVSAVEWNSNRCLHGTAGATVRWGDHELWDTTQFMPLPALNWGTRSLVGSWNLADFYAGNFRKVAGGDDIQYNTFNPATINSTQALTGAMNGIWLRNTGSAYTGSAAIRSRSPALGLEYSTKFAGAGSPTILYKTFFSATSISPFEVYSSAGTTSGLGLIKILNITSNGNIFPSLGASNLYGTNAFFGSYSDTSGQVLNLTFGPAQQITQSATPSGTVDIEYTIRMNITSSFDGSRTLRVYPTFAFPPANGYFEEMAESYFAIPSLMSGMHTFQKRFRIGSTGEMTPRLYAQIVHDSNSEAFPVDITGFLRVITAGI